jgi:predicted phage terminase large subunit-like protein
MKSKMWKTLFFKAHNSFDDFGNVLWPEMWSEASLRSKRQLYIDDQDPAGYSQEYLNDPHDDADAFLKSQYFREMTERHREQPKLTVVGVDFAISKADTANRTSLTVVGQDVAHDLSFLDERVGRWDSEEIIEEIFSVQARWRPDVFFVESGQIWLAMWPTIRKEMLRTGKFINFEPMTPIKDKKSRGRAWQKRMKAGACYFDKEAEWYPAYEEECLRFTGDSEATLDDQFDSSAIAVLGLENWADAEEEDFEDEEEVEMRRHDPRNTMGRSPVTGY